jgi:hypothetical protein
MGKKIVVDDTHSRGASFVRAFDIFYSIIGRGAFYLHAILKIQNSLFCHSEAVGRRISVNEILRLRLRMTR